MTNKERAKLMHSEGMNFGEIGRALGFARNTVRCWIMRPGTQPRLPVHNYVLAVAVPSEALEDRDHRYTLEHPDFTSAFCGDPLPGYSALDRRKTT